MKGIKHYPKSLQALFYISMIFLFMQLTLALIALFQGNQTDMNLDFIFLFLFAITAMYAYDTNEEIKMLQKRIENLSKDIAKNDSDNNS